MTRAGNAEKREKRRNMQEAYEMVQQWSEERRMLLARPPGVVARRRTPRLMML